MSVSVYRRCKFIDKSVLPLADDCMDGLLFLYESLTKNVPCPLRYGHTYLNKGDRLIESNLLMTNGPHTSSHPNQKLVYFPHEIPRMQSSGCVNKCINKLFYNMHFR